MGFKKRICLTILLGCSADPVEANRRIWDGSKTTGTQAVYVCDDGRVSYGVCKEDGTWDYRSINNNVSWKLEMLLSIRAQARIDCGG